jgi:excisionase family DNA binding protein
MSFTGRLLSNDNECEASNPQAGGISVTVKEAAKRLEISQSLCYRLIEEGRLPCRRIGQKGRRGKIIETEDDYAKFMESVKAGAS